MSTSSIREAIATGLAGVDLDAYRSNRMLRSSIEREFIIIGEAVNVLSLRAPDVFVRIGSARRVVDFRNHLTHEYAPINDAVASARES